MMNLSVHFLSVIIVAALLFRQYSYEVLAIIAGGFLIDIDHYLWYVYHKKKYDIVGAYRHYRTYVDQGLLKNVKSEIYIFHNLEFLTLVAVAAFYSRIASLFLIGLVMHYILDWINEIFYIKGGKNISFFHWLFIGRHQRKE